MYDFLETVISLPNVSVIEPCTLPVKIDLLVCGMFGDFSFKAWFIELQDNINAVNIKHKLITDSKLLYYIVNYINIEMNITHLEI